MKNLKFYNKEKSLRNSVDFFGTPILDIISYYLKYTCSILEQYIPYLNCSYTFKHNTKISFENIFKKK